VKRAIGFVTSDERSFYWASPGARTCTSSARCPGSTRAAGGAAPEMLDAMELAPVADQQFLGYSPA